LPPLDVVLDFDLDAAIYLSHRAGRITLYLECPCGSLNPIYQIHTGHRTRIVRLPAAGRLFRTRCFTLPCTPANPSPLRIGILCNLAHCSGIVTRM
jgi:hypothetical protein